MSTSENDRSRWTRIVSSWLWALIPLWTIGVGTAPAMVWAALHKRSRLQAGWSVVYVLAIIAAFATTGSAPGSIERAVLLTSMAVNGFVGLGHALVIRQWAFDLEPDDEDRPSELLARQQAALELERERARARAAARALADEDPVQACLLRIGRIDLPERTFPDGGLIDVNNVPAPALAKALDISFELAHRIVAARDRAGGFTSVDELSVLAELPPNLLYANTDQLIFLPRRG
ncbi:MAG TPA: helix-hairpin-helix domain-containing protein [Actinopolymorphaceae bacterium]